MVERRASMLTGERSFAAGYSGAADGAAARRVEFLGVIFDSWSLRETLAWLGARDAESAFAYVVTPNVDGVVRLENAPEHVRRTYRDAALLLCDSRVLARLAALVGVRLTVVPGSDLTAELFRSVLKAGDHVCLIGGGEGDAARLTRLRPDVVFTQHRPPMGLIRDAAARTRAVDEAVAAGARFTLFAVGVPQQELLAHEMAGRPEARGTGLCIGASVEFLVGTQRRAPKLVQYLGMEWAWRLSTDPRRLAKRYLVDGPRIFSIVWRWRRQRGGEPGA